MHLKRLKTVFIILLLTAGALLSNAQDPHRFKKEIEVLTSKDQNFKSGKELVVFTGSSSMKLWKDAPGAFPGYNVVNNGFGGSHYSDLLFYYDELIVKPQPDILFIYEGDNDIASGKDPRKVRDEARELINRIRKDLPDTEVILVGVKPSVARWEFENNYKALNRFLRNMARRTPNVSYADMWSAMTDKDGEVYKDIFVDDNLHLNEKGYEIWVDVLGRHLNE